MMEPREREREVAFVLILERSDKKDQERERIGVHVLQVVAERTTRALGEKGNGSRQASKAVYMSKS